MSEERTWTAIWRLKGGALQDEVQARALFEAIGAVVAIRPRWYDLNQLGQWRPYSEDALIVDGITQRTQLIVLSEERELSEEGPVVMISTGKRGEAPQAVGRWRGSLPGGEEREEWMNLLAAAFRATPLGLGSFRLQSEEGLNVIATGEGEERREVEARYGVGAMDDEGAFWIWTFWGGEGNS